jgi:hypothetical protein
MAVTCSLKVTLPRVPIHFRVGLRSAATATGRLESNYAPRDVASFSLPSETIPQIVCNTSSTLRSVVSMCCRSMSIPVNSRRSRVK